MSIAAGQNGARTGAAGNAAGDTSFVIFHRQATSTYGGRAPQQKLNVAFGRNSAVRDQSGSTSSEDGNGNKNSPTPSPTTSSLDVLDALGSVRSGSSSKPMAGPRGTFVAMPAAELRARTRPRVDSLGEEDTSPHVSRTFSEVEAKFPRTTHVASWDDLGA